MAHALGSLDPAICERLEESKALLSDKVEPDTLSQVLIDVGLLGRKACKNMVYDFQSKCLCVINCNSSLHALFNAFSCSKC